MSMTFCHVNSDMCCEITAPENSIGYYAYADECHLSSNFKRRAVFEVPSFVSIKLPRRLNL